MKTKLFCLLMSGFFTLNSSLSASEAVSHISLDSALLVNVEEAGKQFGWAPKLEGNTLVLCRDKLCVPVDLEQVAHLKNGDQLYIDADALGKILGFSPELADKRVTLKPTGPETFDDRSAYHAGWPSGRGFEVGQTLPDIPLIDLEGNEVRFSDFLGKRYVIYGWASW